MAGLETATDAASAVQAPQPLEQRHVSEIADNCGGVCIETYFRSGGSRREKPPPATSIAEPSSGSKAPECRVLFESVALIPPTSTSDRQRPLNCSSQSFRSVRGPGLTNKCCDGVNFTREISGGHRDRIFRLLVIRNPPNFHLANARSQQAIL